MKITITVDGERQELPLSDFCVVDGVVTLSDRVKAQVREWQAQHKDVDVLIEYSSDYFYHSSLKIDNETWSWYHPTGAGK